MDKGTVISEFKKDDRFDGKELWNRLFKHLEPDDAYEALKLLFNDDEISHFPEKIAPEFDSTSFEKFTDNLANKISEFETLEDASEDLEYDIDLDVLEKLEPAVNEIAKNRIVDAADAKIIKDVYELVDEIDRKDKWSKVVPYTFLSQMEDLKKFVDTWEVD